MRSDRGSLTLPRPLEISGSRQAGVRDPIPRITNRILHHQSGSSRADCSDTRRLHLLRPVHEQRRQVECDLHAPRLRVLVGYQRSDGSIRRNDDEDLFRSDSCARNGRHRRLWRWQHAAELSPRTFWNFARDFSSFRRQGARTTESGADLGHGSAGLLGRPRDPPVQVVDLGIHIFDARIRQHGGSHR